MSLGRHNSHPTCMPLLSGNLFSQTSGMRERKGGARCQMLSVSLQVLHILFPLLSLTCCACNGSKQAQTAHLCARLQAIPIHLHHSKSSMCAAVQLFLLVFSWLHQRLPRHSRAVTSLSSARDLGTPSRHHQHSSHPYNTPPSNRFLTPFRPCNSRARTVTGKNKSEPQEQDGSFCFFG